MIKNIMTGYREGTVLMKPILEVRNLTKIYEGGVLANHEVNFSVEEGEIHALVGENGAGKSTLMKMLYGMESVTSGQIFLRGQEVHFTSSKDAINHGIGMVHQHFMLVDSLTGTLMTADAAAWFASFSAQPYSVVPYHIIVVVGTLLTLFLGAHSIEKTNKIMMPLFFLIFLVLAVRVFFLPGAAEGYRFMFTPRWEALTDPMIWIWAMGQAFFSLSVTGSGMIVYGAYLSPQEDVVGVAQHTALFDTIAAVVAALVIIPACFSYGLDVGAGPSLLFVTLPTILQDIPLGQLFAVILYIAMIFAGVSSLQNMFEAVAESLQNRFPRLSRTATLIILAVLCLGFGIGMETISQWGPWMDLVSIYIIPIGATLGAVSWFYVMKKDELLSAINTGSGKTRGRLWYGIGRYLYVPLAVILCCVALFMKVAF